MTAWKRLNITWGAIIPLLLCSWSLYAQAIPTSNPSLLRKNFKYDLSSSETPVVLEGRSATFKCADQMPSDTVVQWLKDGVSVDFTPTSKTKRRRNRIHEKQGLPSTSRRRRRNTVHENRVLLSQSRRSRSRYVRSLKTSLEPDTQTLHTESTSETSRIMNFTNSDFTVLSNGSLRVLKATQAHAGEYKCFMQDSHGRFMRRQFTITVADLPQCTVGPSTLSAHANNAARLFCSTNIPTAVDVTYTWTKNGLPLPNDQIRYEHVPNGALQFFNVSSEDEGKYRCHATSSLGVCTSKAASLTVLPQQPPQHKELQFIVEPQNMTVFPPKHRAIFECLVDDPNSTHSWTKRNGNIREHHSPLGTSHHNLILNNVPVKGVSGYSSSDFYNCMARPKYSREGITKSAYLNVLEKPTVTVYANPDISKVPLSKSVQISCTATGGNPSPKLYWIKNGEVLGRKRSNGALDINWTAGRLYLRITSVESSDAGYYQCVGENTVGAGVDGIRLDTIKVADVPPPVDVVATALSESEVFVQWRHPVGFNNITSYVIRAHPGLNSFPCSRTANNFTLANLHPFTNYTIKVITYGRQGPSEPAVAYAKTRESAPCGTLKRVYLNPYAVNSTAILFMWRSLPRVEQCGIVTNYLVACKLFSVREIEREDPEENFEVQARQHPSDDHPVTEFVLLSGLVAEGQYVLSVKAATSVGEGEESEFADITLPPPQNATCSKNGETAFFYVNGYFHQDLKHLIVVWKVKPLPSFIINIEMVSVDGKYRRIKRTQKVNSSSTSAAFSSVDTRKPYAVTVSIIKHGDSIPCENSSFAVVLEGGNGVDAMIPMHITASLAGSRCIRLSWDYELDYSVSFVVRYNLHEVSAHRKSYMFKNSTTKDALVCGLRPWSSYEFAVAAIYPFETRSENTNFTRLKTVIRTGEEEPGIPADFVCMELERGELECTWRQPANPNGEITQYVLMYQKTGQNVMRNATTKATSIVLSCLQPVEQYIFKVHAVNSAGAGKPSILQTYVESYDESDKNCTFEYDLPDGTTGGPSIKAVLIGTGIAAVCIIVFMLLLCFCLPGRKAKFVMYRSRTKKVVKENGTSHHAVENPRKQNGYARNVYQPADVKGFDEQHVNLIPKNGSATPVTNGSVPTNGYHKRPIVKKNGFHTENSQSKLLNGVTKRNGIRNENGTTGNSYRLDSLRRLKSRKDTEKTTRSLIPETNLSHNHPPILSVPIPKHCGNVFDTKSLQSDRQDPGTSSLKAKNSASFSDVD